MRSLVRIFAALGVALIAGLLYRALPLEQKVNQRFALQGGVCVLVQLHTSPDVPAITADVQSQRQTRL